jgi:DNA-binding CsgD family transcriptional regulator
LESRIREELQVLLQPLLEDLENRARTNDRAAEWKTLLRHIVDHVGSALPGETSSLTVPFTARERLIACLLTAGRDVERVAGLLGLSRRSVENHCQRMRRKLGLQGRRPTLRDWLAGRQPRETR